MNKVNIKAITSEEEFQKLVNTDTNSNILYIVYFWADWAEPCGPMEEVLITLAEMYPKFQYLKVEAEELADLSESFEIDSVPSFVFLKGKKLLTKVEGASASELTETIEKYAKLEGIISKKKEIIEEKEDLNIRLEKLINLDKVTIFIKGTPETPRCGFSRQLVTILKEQGVKYAHFDILSDEEVRQGLKKYSNWPTYPQVYINGELIGGLDIIKEMVELEEFLDNIPEENRTLPQLD